VWFRRLNEEAGYRQQPFWQRLPGKCEDEKTCRQVILWVRMRMSEIHRSPDEVEAAVRVLEGELDEHIARHGKVLLPDG
jgi:hypothetical protein